MSSNPTSKQQEPLELDAEAIAEYLHQHPEFFDDNPDILTDLKLSHEVKGAVSIVERQISALRNQNSKLKAQLENLIQIARENDKVNERMHKLILNLMDSNSLNEVFIALDDSLRGDFEADAVTVKLFVDPENANVEQDSDLMQTIFVPMEDSQLNGFKTILSHEKPVCGQLKTEQITYLFGDKGDDIHSAALIPLGGDRCSTIECSYLGILAIGSHEENRFHTNMGTLFLSNLGDILSRAIRPYIAAKGPDE